MFYKLTPIILIAATLGLLSNNAHSQEFNLLSEEIITPPQKQTEEKTKAANPELGIEDASILEETFIQEDLPQPQEIKEEEKQANAPQAILPKEVEAKKDETKELLKEYKESVDDEIFNKMTELERQSALLSLQLKKEKIQNDIQAVQKQRQAAEDQEIARKEALEQKRRETIEKKQKEMLEEQQKLKEKEIELEKLRQEKLVNQYKETMLEEKQKWIQSSNNAYKDLSKLQQQQTQSYKKIKDDLKALEEQTKKATQDALSKKTEKDAEISSLKSQLSILQAQIKTLRPDNTLGQLGLDGSSSRLDNQYVIMEIRGQGDELIAKLLNKNGQTFLAQKGTVLQTGHIVEDITQSYLKANKEGNEEYVYFASGASILQKEPQKKDPSNAKTALENTNSAPKLEQKPMKKFNIYTGG